MLDRVSTIVLGLDGRGGAQTFADYSQWEEWQRGRSEVQGARDKVGEAVAAHPASGVVVASNGSSGHSAGGKKKLSYLEAREFAGIEEAVEAAEDRLQAARERIEDPAVAIDAAKLTEALAEMESAQRVADDLYARWAELTEKAG